MDDVFVSGAGAASGAAVDFAHDALDRRVEKKVTLDGGGGYAVLYVWDGWRVAAELRQVWDAAMSA